MTKPSPSICGGAMPKRTSKAKAKQTKAPPKVHGVPHNPDQAAKPITTKAGMESHVRSLNLRCQGPRDDKQMAQWQGLMDAGKVEEARVIQTRTGCGYDFGQTVLSEPFDGAEHESTCPKCGVVTSWRSPTLADAK